jgi:hypothetical protein
MQVRLKAVVMDVTKVKPVKIVTDLGTSGLKFQTVCNRVTDRILINATS